MTHSVNASTSYSSDKFSFRKSKEAARHRRIFSSEFRDRRSKFPHTSRSLNCNRCEQYFSPIGNGCSLINSKSFIMLTIALITFNCDHQIILKEFQVLNKIQKEVEGSKNELKIDVWSSTCFIIDGFDRL